MMHRHSRFLRILPQLGILLLVACATAGTPGGGGGELPMDPAILSGRLNNGFHYYVRANAKPAGRAILSLIVRAGSLHEQDGEEGLAHFVEHMAFNGTRRFPRNEIVRYFETIGMRFGDGINAFTSFEETVYYLEIPTNDPQILETSFQILEDWSRDLSFDPDEVEREKGVIEEEWRLGLNVNSRRRDFVLPLLFNRSRWAERLPIGRMETVRAATPEKLRAFYRRWYRPERMAIVAVGDFDPRAIQDRIRQGFSWVDPTPPPQEPSWPIRPYESRSWHFFNDPEQPHNIIHLARMEPARYLPWAQRRRLEMLDAMTKGAVDQRLSDLQEQDPPPFLTAFTDWNNFARRFWVSSLYVVSQPGQQVKALEAALKETERIRRLGFTRREWERERNTLRQEMELLLTRADDREHQQWATDIGEAFLFGYSVPSVRDFVTASLSILEDLTLAEWNAHARQALDLQQRLGLVLTNTSRGAPPQAEALEAVVVALPQLSFDPQAERSITALIETPPDPVALAARQPWPQIGFTQWTLPNGVQVYARRTDFKAQEVLIRAFRVGGLSLAEDVELPQAAWTVDLLSESGLGPWTHAQLRDFLADKNLSLELDVDEPAVWITGSSTTRDLEVWFQFLYLRLTALNPSPSAFRSVQTRMIQAAEARRTNPELRFQDFLNTLLRGGPTRSRVLTPEAVRSARLEDVVRWDQRLFSGGQGWVFVIVGDVDLNQLERLVRTYLGNLPQAAAEQPKARATHPTARGPQILRAGQERRALVYQVWPFEGEFSIQDLVTAQALVEIVKIRLRDRIREEQGGTYSIQFDFQYRPVPSGRGYAWVQFGTNPDRYRDLANRVRQELEQVLRQGVTTQEVQVFREIRTRDLERLQKENRFWVNNVVQYVFGGRDLNLLPRFMERIQAVQPEMVQAIAQRMLHPERVFEAVLLPEN